MASCGSIMPWLLMVSLDLSQAFYTYAGFTPVPSLPGGFSCNEINNKIKIEIKDTSTLTPSNISPRFLTRKKMSPLVVVLGFAFLLVDFIGMSQKTNGSKVRTEK